MNSKLEKLGVKEKIIKDKIKDKEDKKKFQEEIQKERLKLSTRQFLISLLNLPMAALFASHPYYSYRKIYGSYKKWQRQDKLRYYNILYQLKKQELILFDYEEGARAEIPKLTNKGRQKALKYFIQEIDNPRTKKWDQRWRLIIFDVPDKKKTSREYVRKELKNIGFFRLQESVFIYPFECKNEIEFIRLAAGLSKYNLCYVRADNFDLSPQILNHFIKRGLLDSKEINK